MSERTGFFQYFTRKQLQNGIFSFDDLFMDAIEAVLNKKGAERDKYFDANANRMWNYILKRQEEEFNQKKIEPLFSVVNTTTRIIKCHLKNCFSTNAKPKYRFLQSRPLILNEIDLLNAREYEALSILICKLLNANNFLLTPPGNEAGIDFIATIKFSNDAHFLFGINGPIKIIGQCKKYATPVQVDKVKEFNSTLNDVHHLTVKMRNILPQWFLQSQGIIVGWIISHSGFQQGAKDRAKDFGIILSETRDLGDLISCSKKFYITTPLDQRHNYLKQEIVNILSN